MPILSYAKWLRIQAAASPSDSSSETTVSALKSHRPGLFICGPERVAADMITVMDLFAEQRQKALARVEPLAVRMRPRTLDEFAGQQHFLGPGKLLRRLLAADRLTSAIF